MNLAEEKKLTVFYKMEPGCLGPQGETMIEQYCRYAQEKIEGLDENFVNWVIEPRFDKKLPEVQYKVNGKELISSMVERYLAVFGRDLDEFEESFNQKLTEMIEEFLDRKEL